MINKEEVAVKGATDSLASLVDLKPKADLPKDAEDLGLKPMVTPVKKRRHSRNDAIDLAIAEKRLKEIADDPTTVIKGKKLEAALKALLSEKR